MKKLVVLLTTLLLAALLLAACAAPAPGAQNTPDEPEPQQEAPEDTPAPEKTAAPAASVWQLLGESAPISGQSSAIEMLTVQADLDADGSPETIAVTSDDDRYAATILIDSATVHYAEDMDTVLFMASAYLADVDTSDGYCELFIKGNMGSDDWTTVVYRVVNGEVRRTEFYDTVLSADGSGMIEVESVVDVLGTYAGRCKLALEQGFTFVRATPYTIAYEADGPEYRTLTLIKDGFPVRVTGGDMEGKDVTLPAGTRLLLRETDEESYAILEGEDGTLYRAALSLNEELDWGWIIGGMSETEWFDTLLYAG